MTRAALTKLLLLVILAFFICLPEFFTLHKAAKVSFLCLRHRPCEHGSQRKESGDAEARREDMCDPSQPPGDEQACTQEHQSNMTDPPSDSRRGGDEAERSWFMCETDMNMSELYSNTSSSAPRLPLEVSVKLQLSDAETLNLTLYGCSNHSSLHLRPPEEEEEEEGDDEGQREAFYCCFPLLPTSESANHSRCLLWLANQTVLKTTAKEALPWKRTQRDEWRCMFRVLWLALLCVVLLTVVTAVIGQIYWRRRLCRKPRPRPVGYDLTSQQLNDGEKQTDPMAPRGTTLHSQVLQSCSGLSPIQEVDSQDDTETLLEGNADHGYTANLHHRSHPFTSSLTEEQVW